MDSIPRLGRNRAQVSGRQRTSTVGGATVGLLVVFLCVSLKDMELTRPSFFFLSSKQVAPLRHLNA